MKNYIPLYLILLSLIAGIHCRNGNDKNDPAKKNGKWTEEQKRKYFRDSIAYQMNRAYNFEFFREQYPDVKMEDLSYNRFELMYAMEEDAIEKNKIDSARQWFRIIVDPSIEKPYCIVAEKKFGITRLTCKMTDGLGKDISGTLQFAFQQDLDDSICENIFSNLHAIDFWKLSEDSTCQGGFDGAYYSFEAIDKGKYKIIYRWMPVRCESTATKALAEMEAALKKLSKLDAIANPKAGKK